jgi:hypothetical protein
MKKNYVLLCMAAAVPFAASTALAQAQPATPPADADYTLKAPASQASQVTGTAYELSGTSISGSSKGGAQSMLTAPVGKAGAYKTESGVYIYPSAFVGMGYNDNLQSAATNPVGSNMVNVAPKLIFEMKLGGDRLTALASANTISYASSSADNTVNSEFKLAGDHYMSTRARAAWSPGPNPWHRPPWFQQPPGFRHARPLDVQRRGWPLCLRCPRGPQGRVEFDIGNRNKSYDNNRATTAISDVTTGSYAARGFYRLGTRSLALAEYRNAKANYVSNLSKESNTEKRYYVGLTWDATAATTGIFKLGRMTKDFDVAGRSGFDGDSWEAAVKWAPLTYSEVDFQTSRFTGDTTGIGLYSIYSGTNLNWSHQWNRSVSTRAGAGWLKTDYAGTTRSDNTTTYTLAADYAILRWLKLGVDWSGTERTSNATGGGFKGNVTMFTLNASL